MLNEDNLETKEMLRELHWFCSDSGHREAFVYHNPYRKEYQVKMVEVKFNQNDKTRHTKEIRSMGNHSEQYAEDCAENWVMEII